jgi:hypothetical protein
VWHTNTVCDSFRPNSKVHISGSVVKSRCAIPCLAYQYEMRLFSLELLLKVISHDEATLASDPFMPGLLRT